MDSVLLLNATYEPLSVVTVRRAIVLLIKEKAELIEAADQEIRAATVSFHVPLVIRLVYYVRVPERIKMPVTRTTIMVRDNYTCQYCGKRLPRSELTLDHVIPRSRGGKTTWENVVCACQKCNVRKGAKSLVRANMKLLRRPTKPHYLAIAVLGRAPSKEAWRKYMPDSVKS